MYLNILPRNFCRARTICTLKINNLCTNVTAQKNHFTPVYSFPYVRAAGLVNRLKIYQTGLTLVSIPGSIALYNFGVISPDSVVITWILGLTGTLSLFLFGMIPNKLIGFVYLNNDGKTVKISYLDFWGRRKNTEIPTSDIVPLTDLPAIPTDPIYLTLRRFSSKETFKINLKFGIVMDKSKFKTVFLQEM